jgi:hypothetical protein
MRLVFFSFSVLPQKLGECCQEWPLCPSPNQACKIPNYSTGRPTHGKRVYNELIKYPAFQKHYTKLELMCPGGDIVETFVTAYNSKAKKM